MNFVSTDRVENSQGHYRELFLAGAGTNAAARAAVHLLLATEIDLGPLFHQRWAEMSFRPGPDGQPVQVAYVTDWTRPEARYDGTSVGKLLRIAGSLGEATTISRLNTLVAGLKPHHARALAEAMLIATGMDRWFSVEPTASCPDRWSEEAS